MDGRGRWVDNVMIERFWRTIIYEDIYLKSYRSPNELERGIAKFMLRYNSIRPHKALNRLTPDEVYGGGERPWTEAMCFNLKLCWFGSGWGPLHPGFQNKLGVEINHIVKITFSTDLLLKSERPSSLAQAIIEAGRTNKTLYFLNYIDDEDYRRRILIQLKNP